MAQIIYTNVPSLVAQRNLNSTTNAMATSIQRLSSGLRINSAKDDAAGLAISDRMTAQINGMNQAIRNANDGISLAQVAEGAMQETTNILQRMRQLAIQAANASNSPTDKQSIQDEISQLTSEMDQIASTTELNGQKILDGSFSNAVFQVGSNSNQTISFSIGSMSSKSLGALVASTGSAVSGNAAANITVTMGSGSAVTINSSANYATSVNGQDSSSAFAKAAALNDANIAGLKVNASTSGSAAVGSIGGAATDTYSLTINGVAVFNNYDVSTALSNSELLNAINNASAQTGVVGSLSNGVMTLTAEDGRNINISEGGTNFVVGNGLSSATGSFAGDSAGTVTVRGTLSVSANQNIAIGGTAADLGLAASISTDNLGVSSIDVTTQAGAQLAIDRIDSALATVDSSRAGLGAVQSRFESTIGNLQNVSDNTSSARSRVRDADYAAEMANLTKNQILQQAGTAMLAQANSLPQSVLSLLGH